MSLHTYKCKWFLEELNEYLDDSAEPEVRQRVEQHIHECPNCWVVLDTPRKTLAAYKVMEAQTQTAEVQERLMKALERKLQSNPGECP
ncbi:MAG: zf-HC2 domain-containing protein [Acidobacteria bacterium]|nr:zf-HC2 domain-containing protein [Acidobacteriota bacterium]